jgi:hypothetical protein
MTAAGFIGLRTRFVTGAAMAKYCGNWLTGG